METTLNANAISFIGLCKEYCETAQSCLDMEREELVEQMLRLLPRLYITATDLRPNAMLQEAYLDNALDEDDYNALRNNLEQIFGEDDTYLEVFEEDMKFSDTPVGASIAEGLADLFQVFYNFMHAILDATDSTIQIALAAVVDDFKAYWSATLCNVLRALNRIQMNS